MAKCEWMWLVALRKIPDNETVAAARGPAVM